MFLRSPLLLLLFFVNSVSNAGIIVDGDPSDWAAIPALITDPAGDIDANGNDADIVSIKVTSDSNFVYILLERANPPGASAIAYLFLDTDMNPATGCRTAVSGLGVEYAILFATFEINPGKHTVFADARDCGWGGDDFPGALTAIPHNFYEYFPPNICENAPDS
jgi:hypothetical protein